MNTQEKLIRYLIGTVVVCGLVSNSVAHCVDAETARHTPPRFHDSAVLESFDFFENYGNKGSEWDNESMTLMFVHDDPSAGISSYKSFRVEIVVPEDEEDIVEFHLKPEAHNEITETLEDRFVYDPNPQKVDLDKAYKEFMNVTIPDKYRNKAIKGRGISFANVQARVDVETDLISGFQVFNISEQEDGSMIFKIKTIIPEEEITLDMKELFPKDVLGTNSEDDDSQETEQPDPQASINSIPGRGNIVEANGHVHYPWSKFSDFLQADVTYSIKRSETNDTIFASSLLSLTTEWNWWHTHVTAEDSVCDVSLKNRVFYREFENLASKRIVFNSISQKDVV